MTPAGISPRHVALPALVTILLVGTAGLARTPPVDVSGDWEIVLDVPQDTITWRATFEQDGETLGGTLVIGRRTRATIEGRVEGDLIRFSFIQEDQDGDFPITMSGRVDGDTIAGDPTSFGLFGEGTWTASRARGEA